MSQFTVGTSTVTFTALEPFAGKGGPLEEWTFDVLIDDATSWGAFFSLRSWNVTQRPVPGGNNVVVDIGGGAGQGYLIVDNRDSHFAIMTSLDEKMQDGGSRRLAKVGFLITG